MRPSVTGKYSYNAVCDSCGFVFKASQLIKRWDGYMVCKDDWEPRNILDFYRPLNDHHQLPFTRPDGDGIDVSPSGPYCTDVKKQAKAGVGTAGCMTAGFII